MTFHNPKYNDTTLLTKFNNRDCLAFGQIYACFFNEIYLFAAKQYKGTEIDASDVVHDVFINIWQNDKIKFESLEHIKAYTYTSIKNQLRNLFTRQKYKERHQNSIITNDDLFVSDIVESEIFSFVQQALNLLPEDCAEIIKFHIEGWNNKEIAEKMNISERSVYYKKNEAISILKKKMERDTFSILTTFFGF